MAFHQISDSDNDEPVVPTSADLINVCSVLHSLLVKHQNGSFTESDLSQLAAQLKLLQDYGCVDGYSHVIFASQFWGLINEIFNIDDTSIMSTFVSITMDICDDVSNIEYVLKSGILETAISKCECVDFKDVQSDAQFLYNTFGLISIILDGCDDGKDFANLLLKKTKLLSLIEKQFIRDDFDENVLAASETLAILLQIQPEFAKEIDIGLVNLLLRFCANLMNPKSASEDEAAHNAFNAVILLALDEKGNQMIEKLNGLDIMLNCWSSKASSASLAIKTIESILSASEKCCLQFIDAGGIKKLFGSFKVSLIKSSSTFLNIIGILDSLLTMLPIDSTYFKRVIRKFEENECEKTKILIKFTEYLFDILNDKDPDSYDNLGLICTCIIIIFGYGSIKIQAEIIASVSESESLDFQLIIDSTELRIEGAKYITDKVKNSIKKLKEVIDE